jgi:hypothetical protein
MEPLSGATMNAHKRLQVNLWLPKTWFTPQAGVLNSLVTGYGPGANSAVHANFFNQVPNETSDVPTTLSKLFVPISIYDESTYTYTIYAGHCMLSLGFAAILPVQRLRHFIVHVLTCCLCVRSTCSAGQIKDDDAKEFREKIYDNRDLADNLRIIFIVVGAFFMVAALGCFYHFSRKGTGMDRLESKADLTN